MYMLKREIPKDTFVNKLLRLTLWGNYFQVLYIKKHYSSLQYKCLQLQVNKIEFK